MWIKLKNTLTETTVRVNTDNITCYNEGQVEGEKVTLVYLCNSRHIQTKETPEEIDEMIKPPFKMPQAATSGHTVEPVIRNYTGL